MPYAESVRAKVSESIFKKDKNAMKKVPLPIIDNNLHHFYLNIFTIVIIIH